MSDRAVGARAEVEWVAANLNKKTAKKKDCPSDAAWCMWQDLKELKGAERARLFWIGIYSKLLPTRQQLDKNEGIQDDGRRLDRFLEEIAQKAAESEGVDEEEDAILSGGAEDGGGEPGVPQEGADGGPGEPDGAGEPVDRV